MTARVGCGLTAVNINVSIWGYKTPPGQIRQSNFDPWVRCQSHAKRGNDQSRICGENGEKPSLHWRRHYITVNAGKVSRGCRALVRGAGTTFASTLKDVFGAIFGTNRGDAIASRAPGRDWAEKAPSQVTNSSTGKWEGTRSSLLELRFGNRSS